MPRHASSMSFKPGIEHICWRGGTSEYWRREARKVVNCPKGLIVHHKDGNYKNNNFENLQIMTQGNHIRLHNLSAFGHKAMKKRKEASYKKYKKQVIDLTKNKIPSRKIAKQLGISKNKVLRIRRYYGVSVKVLAGSHKIVEVNIHAR